MNDRMEIRKENSADKRRRKVVARPVLVRSERPGKVMSVSYSNRREMPPIWRD